MQREVEILKIGTLLKGILSKHEILEGKQEKKDTIMTVFNGGPIIDYYVNILKENCGNDYVYLSTDQSIVGTPEVFRSSLLGNVKEKRLKGTYDGDPEVGSIFTIDNGAWHTSTVLKVIEEDIIITKNSVYAIHDISKMRNKRLKDLGIN